MGQAKQELQQSNQEGLNTSVSRRGFVKGFAGLVGGHAVGRIPLTEPLLKEANITNQDSSTFLSYRRLYGLRETGPTDFKLVESSPDPTSPVRERGTDKEAVPSSLSDAFTSDIEQANRNPLNLLSITSSEGQSGTENASFTLIKSPNVNLPNFVQELKLDKATGKYRAFENRSDVPMQECTAIVALPGSEAEAVTVVAGGGNMLDQNTPTPALYISRDSAASFGEPIKFRLSDGNDKFPGLVLDIKHIPGTQKVLTSLLLSKGKLGYGIVDVASGEYTPVTSEIEALPTLDDVSIHPDNPSLLLGSGRVMPLDASKRGSIASLTDFVLDIESATIVDGKSHHFGLPYVQGFHVVRGDDGTSKTAYAFQTVRDASGNFAERNRFVINMQDEKEYDSLDYGKFMDEMIRKNLDMGEEVNKQMAEAWIYAVLSHIDVSPSGTWVTGKYDTRFGPRPLAAYWPADVDPSLDPDAIKPYLFDSLRLFPSPITQEPQFVKFYNRNLSLDPGKKSIDGVLVNLGYSGLAFIQTDSNKPIDAKPLFSIRNSSGVSS